MDKGSIVSVLLLLSAALIVQAGDIEVASDYSNSVGGIRITENGTSLLEDPSPLLPATEYLIKYKIRNNGNLTEKTNITVSVGNITLNKRSRTVAAGESIYLTEKWDTSDVGPGNYSVTVEAVIPEDMNQTNNIGSRNVVLTATTTSSIPEATSSTTEATTTTTQPPTTSTEAATTSTLQDTTTSTTTPQETTTTSTTTSSTSTSTSSTGDTTTSTTHSETANGVEATTPDDITTSTQDTTTTSAPDTTTSTTEAPATTSSSTTTSTRAVSRVTGQAAGSGLGKIESLTGALTGFLLLAVLASASLYGIYRKT